MLCRATYALISVRLDYNNLRKKYRNFCFFMYLFLFIIFFSLNAITVIWPPKNRQNMSRWKRQNRSAYK